MRPIACHPIPGCKSDDSGPHFQDNPRIAVPKRDRLIQLVENSLHRGHQSVGSYLIHNLLYFLWLLPDLLEPTRLSEINHHPLSSRGNQSSR